MRLLRDLENMLLRVESVLAVVLVLTMLGLAGYNVLYRNVLVPLQQHWAHSGPPIDRSAPADAAEPAAADPAPDEAPAAEGTPPPKDGGGDDFGGFGGGFDEGGEPAPAAEGGGDDFGGFGGGFGEDEPEAAPKPAPEPKPEPAAAADEFDGFGGGFGEDEPEPEAEPAPKPAPAPKPEAKSAPDDFGGFGGGFGDEPEPEAKPAPAPADGAGGGDFGGFGGGFDEGGTPAAAAADDAAPEPEEELGEDDFGEDDFGEEDEFANLPSIDAVAESREDEGPVGGPPPEGSFAAWGVKFVDAIKLEWIDVFLRQLVIIVAFLGATMATQRRKHINIDAVSRLLPAPVRRVVPVVLNLVSLGVCLMLAQAGWDLVKIGQEFPVEVTPWAEEWKFQLMFPVGFGLLALHFAVRVVESIVEPPAEEGPVAQGAALAKAAAEAAEGAEAQADADADAQASDEAEPAADDDGDDDVAEADDAEDDEAEEAASDKGGQS